LPFVSSNVAVPILPSASAILARFAGSGSTDHAFATVRSSSRLSSSRRMIASDLARDPGDASFPSLGVCTEVAHEASSSSGTKSRRFSGGLLGAVL